jgi:FAD:protein FMN transferase
VIHRLRPLLGTYVAISAGDGAAAAIEAAFGAVERVQRLMSFHDPTSELSRLNREGHLGPRAVDAWTWRVLREARLLFERSGGLFDPAHGGDLVRCGLLPRPGSTVEPRPKATFAAVRLSEAMTVVFDEPVWLDLGGLAKGFAVDAAIATLRASGVRQALVNAGGDLRVLGSRPEPILVRDGSDPRRSVPLLSLANGACATSGDYFGADGKGSEIVDREGRRLAGHRSATVVAPRCIWADGLTKICVLAGRATADVILAQYGAHRVTR